MTDPNSTDHSPAPGKWTSAQVYVLAVICLAAGLAVGYLFRGSASNVGPSAAAAKQPGTAAMPAPVQQPVTPERLKQMADTQVRPLLAELRQRPGDTLLLTRIGNIYYDAQQFNRAIGYYQKVLAIQPANADVRTDMATCYWYLRDPDKAISEFEKSLRFNPTHPGTLLNMGVVKWQGKMDIDGAVAAWQKLLRTNPEFAQRANVEELIARAKQHASVKH